MTLNLSCCQNVNFEKLVCCKTRPETDSPTSDDNPTDVVNDTVEDPLGKPITLVESDHVKFDSLLPDHNEFIYLKILKDNYIIAAEGEFMDDIGMEKDDFLGRSLCGLDKNRELFGNFICPLFNKSVESGSMYQFCFRVNSNPRIICCSIYPCTMPGMISSVDCVIRPALFELDLERFVVKVPNSSKKNSLG